MHSLNYLAILYFWATCLSYDISIQVRFNLIMQHAHSPYSGLADLYTHAVNACFLASSYTYILRAALCYSPF